MSNLKIITYVLKKPERYYEDFIKAIKDYETCAKITEFTWFVSTSDSCIRIMDTLKKHVDFNDRLFVTEISGVSAWQNIICKT